MNMEGHHLVLGVQEFQEHPTTTGDTHHDNKENTRRIDDTSESNLSFGQTKKAPQNFRSFQVKIGDLGLSRGIAVDGETGEDCFRCGSFSTSFLTVWHE